VLLEAVVRNLLGVGGVETLAARVVVLNVTSGAVLALRSDARSERKPQLFSEGSRVGASEFPWLPPRSSDLRPPQFMQPAPQLEGSHRGRWTVPYYSCYNRRWIMSYTVAVQPKARK
jgi:hypothetical protein